MFTIATEIAEKNTVINNEIVKSKAYNCLTGYAPQLLSHLYSQLEFEPLEEKNAFGYEWSGQGCLEIVYSFFLENYGITHPRLSLGIKNLIKYGFIEQIHNGGNLASDKSIYAISDKWEIFEEMPLSKTGYIYILKAVDKYKIGRTINYKTRMQGYITANPDIEMLYYAKVKDCFKKEKEIHAMFKSKVVTGEWFNLAEDDIKTIKHFLTV